MTRRSDNLTLAPADVLELNPVDLAEHGLADGAPVHIESPWGETHANALGSDRIARGTAFLSFHFPETRTNALMSPVMDRLADCPEYKVTPIRIGPLRAT